MTEENKDIVAAEVTPVVDDAVTPEVVEADKSIDVAAAAPVEEPVVEETPAAEKSAEVTETPVEAETVVVEESAPVETPVETITLESLSLSIKSLTEKLETVVAQKALLAQAPSAVEQPTGEANDELATAKSRIEELEAKVLELSTPVDRTAALPIEDVTPAVEGEVADEPEVAPKDLRGAVRKFVETTTRK